jgi:thiosulfate dehydrogenase
MTYLLRIAALSMVTMNAYAAPAEAPFNVPAEKTIPTGAEGDAIKLGKSLVMNTKKMLPKNVGSGLNCTNCHLNGGTTALAGPFVGIWGVFPEYRARGNSINSLQERINDCFQRSLNGKALAYGSKEMNAMLMYMQWLSTGMPVGSDVVGRGMGKVDTALKPNVDNGKVIYTQKCASCHGATGEGIKNGEGGYTFPPLWGNASFNIGAGMARTYTAAAFIKHNMPLAQGNTLSDQEAIDVAQYVTHMPRPAYPGAKNDYAGSKKPQDARN